MKRIQAKKYKIGTYEIDKISLSCFDDKRFVLDDVVHTLAYFHKDCNKNVIRMKMKIIITIMIMIIKNDNDDDNDNKNDNDNVNEQYRY